MVETLQDILDLSKNLNEEIINDALFRCEERINDLEICRERIRDRSAEMIRWFTGFELALFTLIKWLSENECYVAVKIALGLIILLIGAALCCLISIFDTDEYPIKGTSTCIWLREDVLTGGRAMKSAMKVKILLNYYKESIEKGKESYRLLSSRYSTVLNYSKVCLPILGLSLLIEFIYYLYSVFFV